VYYLLLPHKNSCISKIFVKLCKRLKVQRYHPRTGP